MNIQNYKHYRLPISMNPSDFGTIIFKNENIIIVQANNQNLFIFSQDEVINSVNLFKFGLLQVSFVDKKLSSDTFVRTINKNIYTFTNGSLIRSETYNVFNRVIKFYISKIDQLTLYFKNTKYKAE